jgi:hypothetical protein
MPERPPTEAPKRKSPSRGALGLGLLIFGTKTHPVTTEIMIDERIRALS